MNKTKEESLELRARESMSAMLEKYKLLDRLAEDMLAKQDRQESIDSDVRVMEQTRAQLAQLESDSRLDRESYRESRSSASVEVKSLTEETTELIKSLLQKITKLETHTRKSYKKLAPEVTQTVRRAQMQQAYGKSN